MDKKWICQSCSTRNKDTKLRCNVCLRSRPKNKVAKPPPSVGNADVVDLTSPHRDAATKSSAHSSLSNSGGNDSKGRTPSTETARSRKRRREREQLDSQERKPQQDQIGEKSGNIESSSSNGSSSNDRPTLMRNGVAVTERNNANRPKHKKTANVSTAAKQQSTLFGRIVDDIRKKDTSKLPTVPKTYERTEGVKAVASAASVVSSAGMKSNGEIGSRSVGNKGPSRSSAPSNIFVEGRFESLKTKSEKVMRERFGIAALRNLQPQAVDGALRGQSQIIVMATGGGKSLCYQLPAAVLPGVTVVVSPLIALMHDQVNALNAKGIPAAMYSSANGQRENAEVLQRLVGRSKKSNGNSKKQSSSTNDKPPPKPLKLVYCTPELLETDRFRAVLTDLHKKSSLALFAIDEAHCLSTWGHDFRPSYRKLSWIRQTFQDVPITACTATATPKVIADIRSCLNLSEQTVPCHLGSFNRENISYEVRYKDNIDSTSPQGSIGDLIAFIKDEHAASAARGEPCSGIVYVHKRDDTSMLAQRITREGGGVRAVPYHAGLKDAQRKEIQKQWTSGTVQVAVATVAFGMGIDLKHVRYVLHWSLAKTVEGFYQESGRGGRDGLPAKSVLYYSKEDASRFAFIIKKSLESKAAKKKAPRKNVEDHSLVALEKMIDYATTANCRRKFLLDHFGEHIDPKQVCGKTCDYCKNPSKTERDIQSSQVTKDVANMLQRSQGRGGSVRKQEWDGQWAKPHGDLSDDEINSDRDDWDNCDTGLGITHSATDLLIPGPPPSSSAKPLGGFVKASTVLDKYERMEVKAGSATAGGFVSFRPTDSSAKATTIPSHLRKNAPDPLQSYYKAKSKPSEGSAEIKAKLRALEEEMAKKDAEIKERQARLLGKRKK